MRERVEKVRQTVAAILLAATLLALAALPAPAGAAEGQERLWQRCEIGVAAGQCKGPLGMATDPVSGDLYVADARDRVSQFTIWGVFVKAWGWGVLNGADELQTCTAQTGCQEAIPGDKAGQFDEPLGVAVGADHSVYVLDRNNHRVQKFDPTSGTDEDEAEFLLTFGREVNKTKSNEPGSTVAQRNLCTAASGDVCQAGTTGTGTGEFESWSPFSNPLANDASGDVYVGDTERVQRFNSGGAYVESIPLPGETVQSLAIDTSSSINSGDLYVSRCNPATNCSQGFILKGSKPDVVKLSSTGTPLGTLTVPNPRALTVDDLGNLFVVDGVKNPGVEELRVHKFAPDAEELPGFPFSDGFDSSLGIATSSACGIAGVDFYVANASNSYVRAYGPPPNPTLPGCEPPEVAPEINAQYATGAEATSATLKALINPNFWPDATYYVEYGTGKCSEGGCTQTQPVPPGSPLTTAVTSEDVETAAVELAGLAPETTYHFRFVSESSGGGPVRGVGGVIGSDGAEGSFTTYSEPLITQSCPNKDLRAQANPNPLNGLPFSGSLAGCRAYELVSPAQKNGGDVSQGSVARIFTGPRKSSSDGERATYSSVRPFADPDAAPLVNQYLSVRGTGGWTSHSISPPRSSLPIWPPAFTGQFKAFDEDLCEAWLLQDSDLALAPGAIPVVADLYKRDYCDPASPYELLTAVNPPGFGPPPEIDPEFYVPNPQGASADGTHTVFRTTAKLTANACATPGINQVYVTSESGPLRLVSVKPPDKEGQATCTNSTAGSFEDSTDGFTRSNVVGAISDDGSRVFWTDTLEAQTIGILGTGPGNLYLRENATAAPSPTDGTKCLEAAKACTIPISESGDARFWGADPEGTAAIYTVENAAENKLFEYDVEEAQSHLIAEDIKGVAGISEDATRVYLISTDVLSGAQQNSEGEAAGAGSQNLYLYELGGGFVFVAQADQALDAESVPDRRQRRPGAARIARQRRRPAPGLHLGGAAERLRQHRRHQRPARHRGLPL